MSANLRSPGVEVAPRAVERLHGRRDPVRLRDVALTREILMGAQDNLTNVLAVMLGVAVGAGRAELVALAGASAAVAEAISMGGVLYSATRAGDLATARDSGAPAARPGLQPIASGLVTFAAALVAGLLPLLPFAFMVLDAAVVVSVAGSLAALFALGSWTGRVGGAAWWREGVRLLVVGGIAAIAAAIIGALLQVA